MHPVTRTRDTGRAQDRQPGMVVGWERGGSRRPCRPRLQGLLRLEPPDLNMRQTLSKESAVTVPNKSILTVNILVTYTCYRKINYRAVGLQLRWGPNSEWGPQKFAYYASSITNANVVSQFMSLEII